MVGHLSPHLSGQTVNTAIGVGILLGSPALNH